MLDLVVYFKNRPLRVETGNGHPYTVTFENGNWLQLEKIKSRPGLLVVDKSWKGEFLPAAELKELSETIGKAEDVYTNRP